MGDDFEQVLFLAQLTAAEPLGAASELLQSHPIQRSLASWSQITGLGIRAKL